MKHLFFYFFCLIIVANSCSPKHVESQSHSNPNKKSLSNNSPPINPYKFPDDWLGNWTGTLKIYNSKGLKQTLPMALDLSKTDSIGIYDWTIIYGQDSTLQRREYQLKEIDTSTGHYLIDEKNDILLDAYHIQNELSSIFKVMGNTLLTSYTLENNELVFTVKMFPSAEVRVSGDTIIAGQTVPKVSSFQLSISQIARLQKKCLVE